jgi:hypothetical protein
MQYAPTLLGLSNIADIDFNLGGAYCIRPKHFL